MFFNCHGYARTFMKQDNLIRRNIVVRRSKIHGYGVFAAEDFKKDDIIEECYTLIFYSEKPYLYNYIFDAGEGLSALPLGSGCIFNHSKTPNVNYSYDTDRQVMIFKALKDIKNGEEITSSYGEEWFSIRDIKIRMPFRYRYRHILYVAKISFRFGLVVAAIWLALHLIQR